MGADYGAELKEYFGYIKSQEDKLWVATFQDVAKYMRERMHRNRHLLPAGQCNFSRTARRSYRHQL